MPLLDPAALVRQLQLPRLAAFSAPATLREAVAVSADSLVLDPGTRMATAARQLLSEVKDNRYTHTPQIDPATGVFHADCSELIDYLTEQVDPQALKELPVDAGHTEVRAQDYYSYLHARPAVGETAPGSNWAQVEQPAALQPGDVIAWKNANYVPGVNSTGHVMLVAEMPSAVSVDGRVQGYNVPIIDSTKHGHGPGDSRAAGQTGLGQGTIYLPTDAKGAAAGFSWTPANAPGAAPVRSPMLAFGRLIPGN